MKRRSFILLLLLIIALTGCDKKEEPVVEPVVEEKPVKENIYSDIYINKINELKVDDEDLTYDLIYLNNDKIPELVVAKNDYNISIYTIKDNSAYAVAEELPYGAFGNSGYEYLEKENIIRNHDSDYAGLIVYTSYYTMDDDMNMKLYYDDILAEYYFNDSNGNNKPDDNEYDETSITLSKYLLGNKEITEEEYNNYIIEGNFIFIQGVKTSDEMINTLNSLK